MEKPTDFEAELARIDGDLRGLEGVASGGAPGGGNGAGFDVQKAVRFVYRLYQRGSLTGDFAELEAAGAAIDDCIGRLRNPSDLYYLKANLDFKFHRLREVKRHLETGGGFGESTPGRALRADLDFQEGRYAEAEAGYEGVVRDERTWDNLARLAHLHFKRGDADSADGLFEEASDELTAKEMRHFSWVELQRGLLDLKRGRYEDAEAHYERAERAYTGHWLVAEHRAELLAARGKFDEASALYEGVLARVPRPELQQALGELYAFMGEPERAAPWFDRALDAYLESARRGGVHYYHHLVDFYADVREDGAEALRWARMDLGLRDNFATRAAVAWALYRDGQFAGALEEIKRSLASGMRDAHLLSQAGKIFRANGADAEGEKYLRMAADINPHFQNFHVHR